ncbi:tail fiber domain-containing protein [Methylobacterium sp. SI9]|uniref:tail fiber domain-containing protein n=1 Tax=Methylobacterium guangdongense TaxID=3138811 RepID=UPI00313C160A
MEIVDINSVIAKINDPEVQKRALVASRRAIIAQLKQDGVELTPEVITSLINIQANAKDEGTAAILGVVVGAALFCDIRLKSDIQLKGRTSLGINLYEFSYKGAPERWLGVIAQEVLEIVPDAVAEHPTGFLIVDYNKLLDVRL